MYDALGGVASFYPCCRCFTFRYRLVLFPLCLTCWHPSSLPFPLFSLACWYVRTPFKGLFGVHLCVCVCVEEGVAIRPPRAVDSPVLPLDLQARRKREGKRKRRWPHCMRTHELQIREVTGLFFPFRSHHGTPVVILVGNGGGRGGLHTGGQADPSQVMGRKRLHSEMDRSPGEVREIN